MTRKTITDARMTAALKGAKTPKLKKAIKDIAASLNGIHRRTYSDETYEYIGYQFDQEFLHLKEKYHQTPPEGFEICPGVVVDDVVMFRRKRLVVVK